MYDYGAQNWSIGVSLFLGKPGAPLIRPWFLLSRTNCLLATDGLITWNERVRDHPGWRPACLSWGAGHGLGNECFLLLLDSWKDSWPTSKELHVGKIKHMNLIVKVFRTKLILGQCQDQGMAQPPKQTSQAFGVSMRKSSDRLWNQLFCFSL